MTRVLCNRLQALLPNLVSNPQSAFVLGCDIGDNVLMAQEVVQQLDRKVRGHNIIFKFDMLKAFDRVS